MPLHVVIDGQIAEQPNVPRLYTFLWECPEQLSMDRICPPIVVPVESGITGYVLLAESHISYHGYGLEVYIDLFSCKPFDADLLLRYCTEFFRLTRAESCIMPDRLNLTALFPRYQEAMP